MVVVGMVAAEKLKPAGAAAAGRRGKGLRERHIRISASVPAANVLKIRPPLVVSRENAGMLVAGMREVLETL